MGEGEREDRERSDATPLPPAKLLFPGSLLTLKEIGLAMINSVTKGPDKRVLEARDIAMLARAG